MSIAPATGSLFKVRCTACHKVIANTDSPICPALAGKGAPEPLTRAAAIPKEDLPACADCGGRG